MNIEEAFGLVLKQKRNTMSLSQEKLAFISQLDRTYISLLERGKRSATIKTLYQLCEVLEIKPEKFIKEMSNHLDK